MKHLLLILTLCLTTMGLASTSHAWQVNSITGSTSYVPFDQPGENHRNVATSGACPKIHAVYYDTATGSLVYGTARLNTPGSWTNTVIDGGSGTDVGDGASIALDSKCNPHIVYFDRTNTALKYAFYDATNGWTLSTVATSSNLENHSGYYETYGSIKSQQLKIDANDTVYISYVYHAYVQNGSNSSYIIYLENSTGSWTTHNTAYDIGVYGVFDVLKFDMELGAQQGSYVPQFLASGTRNTYGGGTLIYVYRNSSNIWTGYEFSASSLGGAPHGSLAIDANNKAHIAYSNDLGAIYYTTNISGSWASTRFSSSQLTDETISSLSAPEIVLMYFQGANGQQNMYISIAYGGLVTDSNGITLTGMTIGNISRINTRSWIEQKDLDIVPMDTSPNYDVHSYSPGMSFSTHPYTGQIIKTIMYSSLPNNTPELFILTQ